MEEKEIKDIEEMNEMEMWAYFDEERYQQFENFWLNKLNDKLNDS